MRTPSRRTSVAAAAAVIAGVAVVPMTAASAATSVSLLPANATWRYHNGGTDLGTSWRSTSYSDGPWKTGTGKMGVGDGDEDTNIGPAKKTAYFRGSFSIADRSAYSDLVLTLSRDDGAVVYLNGTEVTRSNMPSGTVLFGTAASGLDSWDGKKVETFTVPASLLANGANVVAVEVHQAATSTWMSTDVVFKAALTAQTTSTGTASEPAPPPSTSITAPAGWRYVSGDEFSGSSLDTSRWMAYDPSNGRARYGSSDPNTVHCLTKNNVTVGGGMATVKAKKQQLSCSGTTTRYSSGFLGSGDAGRYYPLYGRYEIRARVPHGQALWSGFWLRHVNGSSAAEVDVVETFHVIDPGSVTQTVHFPTSLGTNVAKKSPLVENAVKGTGGWHTYAVDIVQVYSGRHDVVKFTFWVDDRKTLEYTNTSATKWTSVSDKSRVWNIALNLAVGGLHAGHPDNNLGWTKAAGGRCALERPQRSTTSAASCARERTPGKWYNDTITKAPATDGVADIWLAPWNYGQASADYVIDYFRYYAKA